MILEAAILEIRLSFFVISTGYREYKFVLKKFPVEANRLRNHSCASVAGITVKTSCDVEISPSNTLLDVRFNVPDVEDRVEISEVVCLFADGKAAIINRPCGCGCFISSNEIVKQNPKVRFERFEMGQQIRHTTSIDRKQTIQATKAFLVGA